MMSVGKSVVSAGIWAWENFGDQVKPGFLSFLKRKWEDAKENNENIFYTEKSWKEFNWGKAAERYKKHMQEIYGYIRVIGTTEPIPIGDIFTDVYILEQPQAYRRFDISRLQDIQDDPERLGDGTRTRGLKVVVSKRGHRLYILGKPGAGKTTFLKYLVHQTIIADELNKLPIFVTLRDWDVENVELIDFISQQFSVCNFPNAKPFIEYLLETGQAIVLFDGLDEVPEHNKQRVVTTEEMQSFWRKYQKTQIIITCRIAATDYSFTEFTYIEMADFDEYQVDRYAQNWFRKEPEKAKAFLKELKKPENRGLHELGHSPLLLSMICLAYDETLVIPKRRVELYEDALDALLKKWDASRNIQRDEIYKKLSLGRKRQMFSRIATEGFEKGKIFFLQRHLAKDIELYLKNLPPDDTDEIIDGETVLQAIEAQHGILVERASKIYAFAHLTFQEYFTAKYIVDNAHRGTLKRLVEHLSDHRWREVTLLTASLLNEADNLFEDMLTYTDRLLGDDPKLREIQAWVIRKSNKFPAEYLGAIQSLYWYIVLDTAHFDARIRINTLEIARALKNIRDFTEKMLDDQAYMSVVLPKVQNLVDFNDLAFEYGRNITDKIDFSLTFDKKDFDQLTVTEKALILDIAVLFMLSISYFFTTESRRDELIPRYNEIVTYFQKLKDFCKEVSPPLEKSLNKLKLPRRNAEYTDWEYFEKTFRSTVIKHGDIGIQWSLAGTDIDSLRAYLVANSVILDALPVAYIDNRQQISEKLFKNLKH
jgi:hypothetical protein